MAVSPADVRAIVERVCARPEVLGACARGDLGAVIDAFRTGGLTQGRIAGLTGIPQGRLSSAPASALAQGYFVQALALAQAGDDRMLGASILDAMSHQATFMSRYTEAATLSRAALNGTRGIATPTLTAHFHTMEARLRAASAEPLR